MVVALSATIVLLLGAGPAWAASSRSHPYSRRAAAGLAALSHMGTDDRAAAKFASETAPQVHRGYRGTARSSGGGSTLGGVTQALSGSGGGMGFPMPVIMIGTLAVAILYGAWRFRNRERAG